MGSTLSKYGWEATHALGYSKQGATPLQPQINKEH